MTEENCKYLRSEYRCLLTSKSCVAFAEVYDSFTDSSEKEFLPEAVEFCPGFKLEGELACNVQKFHLDIVMQELKDKSRKK